MTPSDPMALSCQDGPGELNSRLEEILARVAGDLDLVRDFSAVNIVADDFQGDGEAWFNFSLAPSGDPRPALDLFCHHESFCHQGTRTRTIRSEREIWEQIWSPAEAAVFDPADFSETRALAFLNHNLLTARDMVRRDLPQDGIGADRIEAFSALWAVTVDGRLQRAGQVGYALAERRGHFSRLFSTAGVLLPDHWQIFQSLWDGGLPGWRDVLAVTDRLPRIRPRSGG